MAARLEARSVYEGAALFAVYFATARASLALEAVGGIAAPVWAPTGIALASLVLRGAGLWPAVALGAFAVNVSVGVPPWAAAMIAAGNTAEALLGAGLLAWTGVRPDLGRVRDVLPLFVAAIPCTGVSAAIGVSAGRVSGVVSAPQTWSVLRAWWVGDLMGALLVAPPLLAWLASPAQAYGRRLEMAAILLAAAAATAFGFWGPAGAAAQFVKACGMFPILVWSAMRFGTRGASAAILTSATVAVHATLRGRGPFSEASLVDSLVMLQAFLALVASTFLILGAAASERDEAARRSAGLNVELERRVERRTGELQALNRELEAFGYSIAHDLRGPLRSIDGFSRAALEDPSLAPAARGSLDRVRAAVERMAGLLDGLLQLSRLPYAEIARQKVDLSAAARQEASELAESEPGRRVRFEIDDALEASGDPRLLSIVVRNLLGNAWKFTGGKAQARVRFGRRPDGAFFVEDDGPGFDMAHAGRLFQPFERLHRREDFPGSGIGLSIVDRIVRRHGGRVWAESAPGKGVTVLFELPGPGVEEPHG